jgi:hypothetical protein
MAEEALSVAPSFDFEEHRRAAVEEYQQVQGLYIAFSETLRSIVKEALVSANLKVASVECRAKTPESFGKKASQPSTEDPEIPKYKDPMHEITDLSGV